MRWVSWDDTVWEQKNCNQGTPLGNAGVASRQDAVIKLVDIKDCGKACLRGLGLAWPVYRMSGDAVIMLQGCCDGIIIASRDNKISTGQFEAPPCRSAWLIVVEPILDATLRTDYVGQNLIEYSRQDYVDGL
jgi:hypothetical protein